MLTRTRAARDRGSGLLRKAKLSAASYKRPEVDALANSCFLAKDANLASSDTDPIVYFWPVEAAHPGGLASLDLAWPEGLQRGLTQPVAVLLGEEPAAAAAASSQGYRCFQNEAAFERFLNEAYAVAA